jgi:hypothetical protein
MGENHSVTCDEPGTPYDPSVPGATTDCSYTWPEPGNYTVTATVYWWVACTATGAPAGATSQPRRGNRRACRYG